MAKDVGTSSRVWHDGISDESAGGSTESDSLSDAENGGFASVLMDCSRLVSVDVCV